MYLSMMYFSALFLVPVNWFVPIQYVLGTICVMYVLLYTQLV